MQIVEITGQDEDNITEKIVIGIDFGTTNSLIAISWDHQARILTGSDKGSEIIPSIVTFITKDDGTTATIVGSKNQENSVRSVKRMLAKSKEEIIATPTLCNNIGNLLNKKAETPKVSYNGQDFDLPTVAAKIFGHLKQQAELELKQEIIDAVVSVPAYFDDNAKGQILLAAKIAGLNIIRLIAEPTAAAYAYGLNKQKEGCYLVYDLGGGTFDVSILNMQTGILQVIATKGDNMLGGDDIDQLFADYLLQKFSLIENIDLDLQKLLILAKDIKHQLTTNNKVTVKDCDPEIIITREEFNGVITPIITKTINITKEALIDAKNPVLDGIILVGGSTKTPLIKQKLADNFKVRIFADIDPDKAVALGAAMQAENLSIKPNAVLIDVLPLSIGLELYGGVLEKIILRNTPIPFTATKEFTTREDMQTGMKFHVVQGERELAKDCRSLANFELKNIPAMKAGKARIEVSFAIDTDGILAITARELTTCVAQNITINPSYGITEKEANAALVNAFENASSDHHARLLLEAKIDANLLIDNLSKAMQEEPDILNKNKINIIEKEIKSLQRIINLDNREDILKQMESLNKLAEEFIQLYLNKGAKLLQGMKISQLAGNLTNFVFGYMSCYKP